MRVWGVQVLSWFPLDTQAIEKLIPHREPFLYVDQVLEVTEKTLGEVVGRVCRAQKKISGDEFFFKGHFPRNPVMPGVLVLEAIAQAGALCCSAVQGDSPIEKIFFGGADNVRFKRLVLPGDTLDLRVEITNKKSSFYYGKAQAFVEGELAVRANILAYIVFKK